jgi:Zn-dependent alcohol dehydrogenase
MMRTKCRAAILLEPNQPLIVDEVELAEPAPDQVLVELSDSGVCHSQLHTMRRPATSCAKKSGVAFGQEVPTNWLQDIRD